MPVIHVPSRTFVLGDKLPPLPVPVVRWAWEGPDSTAWAKAQLHYPLGTILLDVVDGHPVVAQLQTHHNHPDWGPGGNKGVSMYSPSRADESGATVAVETPPAGWGDASAMGADPPPAAAAAPAGGAAAAPAVVSHSRLSLAAAKALSEHEEAEALGMLGKVPRGLTTAGGAGIGFVIGNVPGAILGGAVGLAADLWAWLAKPEPGAKMAGDRMLFRVSELSSGAVRYLGIVPDAEDADEAAWIATRRYFGSRTTPTSKGRSELGKLYETDTGRTMLVERA